MVSEIEDSALKYVILGAFGAVVRFNSNFPVMVAKVEENFDEAGDVESFTIVTASGLRFRTTVTFEEQPPTPNTKEENIEFRKDWDERVDQGKS